jgi:hypothetical protein
MYRWISSTEECVMRTDDLLTLCNHSHADHGRGLERRTLLIGAVLTALLIAIALIEAFAPSAEALVPNTQGVELGNRSKPLDRSGSLGLPILF